MFKATNSFLKKVKKFQKEKHCRKVDILKFIVNDLISETAKGTTHFFTNEALNLTFFKKRIKDPCGEKGKRGGWRIIFALYKGGQSFVIVLITVFSKNEKEDILPEEVLEILKKDSVEDLELGSEVPLNNLEKMINILKEIGKLGM